MPLEYLADIATHLAVKRKAATGYYARSPLVAYDIQLCVYASGSVIWKKSFCQSDERLRQE